jgi:hypothetical protein
MVNLGAKSNLRQYFTCGSCVSEFELVWLDPNELDWPFDDSDDEDEFDDVYEEDPIIEAIEEFEDND